MDNEIKLNTDIQTINVNNILTVNAIVHTHKLVTTCYINPNHTPRIYFMNEKTNDNLRYIDMMQYDEIINKTIKFDYIKTLFKPTHQHIRNTDVLFASFLNIDGLILPLRGDRYYINRNVKNRNKHIHNITYGYYDVDTVFFI